MVFTSLLFICFQRAQRQQLTDERTARSARSWDVLYGKTSAVNVYADTSTLPVTSLNSWILCRLCTRRSWRSWRRTCLRRVRVTTSWRLSLRVSNRSATLCKANYSLLSPRPTLNKWHGAFSPSKHPLLSTTVECVCGTVVLQDSCRANSFAHGAWKGNDWTWVEGIVTAT